MYVLRMRLCNDMVYSYIDCLSERACVILYLSHIDMHRRQQEVTSHSCGGIKYCTLPRLQEWSKMASRPAEKGKRALRLQSS